VEAIAGTRRIADLERGAAEATKRGEVIRARLYRTWLAEIPGSGAEEAKRRLDALPAGDQGRNRQVDAERIPDADP
jgi:hypothetical protein